jgi:rubrerythrin
MPRPTRASAPTRRRVKPTGRLKDLAETKKHPTALLGDIERHLIQRIDQPSDRRQDILHPSEMAKADWCPRQSWYRLSGVAPSDPQKAHGVQLENIFDEGHTIHDKWQTRLWEMGRLWGKFRCRSCGWSWLDTAPQQCPDCHRGKELLEYREVQIDGEEKYLIAGHEDGAVMDINALVEVKSIGQGTLRMEEPGLLKDHLVETVDGKKVYDLDAIWKNLRRPLPSHLRQTGIYLALAKEMGLPFDKVVFIYEYKANQAVKEFVIEGTPRIIEHLLDSALDVKYALEKGKEVPRPGDRTRESKGCKECPWLRECWGDEPVGTKDDEGATDGEQLGSGRPRRRGGTTAADARPRPARPTGRSGSETALGPDRPRRQRSDDAVRGDDGVGVVHRDAAGDRGGRRVVRRRRSEAAGGAVSST